MQAALTRLCLVCIASLQGGCSLHFIGNDGERYDVGLMMIRSHSSQCTISTTVKTTGLTLDLTSDSGGLNVGYRSVSIAKINPDTLIAIENGVAGSLDVRQYKTSRNGERADDQTYPIRECIAQPGSQQDAAR